MKQNISKCGNYQYGWNWNRISDEKLTRIHYLYLVTDWCICHILFTNRIGIEVNRIIFIWNKTSTWSIRPIIAYELLILIEYTTNREACYNTTIFFRNRWIIKWAAWWIKILDKLLLSKTMLFERKYYWDTEIKKYNCTWQKGKHLLAIYGKVKSTLQNSLHHSESYNIYYLIHFEWSIHMVHHPKILPQAGNLVARLQQINQQLHNLLCSHPWKMGMTP